MFVYSSPHNSPIAEDTLLISDFSHTAQIGPSKRHPIGKKKKYLGIGSAKAFPNEPTFEDSFTALTPLNSKVVERDDPTETRGLRFTGRESIRIDFATLFDTQLLMIRTRM